MKIIIVLISLFNFIHLIRSDNITKIPMIKLNDGRQIPQLGFGLWNIVPDRYNRNLPNSDPVNNTYAADIIKQAIEVGYRHLDSAWFYGIEEALGLAVHRVLKDTDFIIKREDLYITAKIWNTFHRRERVIQNLKMSLNEMKLAYVDLTLIHFPLALKEGDEPFPLDQNHILIPDSMKTDQYLDTWKGLEDALDQGLTKSIGVSNFNVTQLSKLVNNSRIKPVVNQVECHPHYQQNKMFEFCKQNNIQLIAYSPLKHGKDLWNETILIEIGKRHNKTVAQVALRWNIQRGNVIIPKTVNKHRMIENFNIFDFVLSNDDMIQINSIPPMSKANNIPSPPYHPDASYVD